MAQKKFPPLSNTELSAFCSQIAMIRRSGISDLEGISLMQDETKDPGEAELLALMEDTIQETGSFYEALKITGAFPDYMLQMVRITEDSSKREEVMRALSTHYEREAGIAQSIKNAVTYPLIMVFMMILVIFVLITKVMPVFNQVFKQLGSEMTGFSRVILNLGLIINRYAAVFIVLVFLLVIAALYLGKTRSGRAALRSFLSHFAWPRSFMEQIAACRFASGMALTLSSGRSPAEAISLASKLIDNDSFQKKIEACKEEVNHGHDLFKSLLAAGIFSGIYARMASVGSKTGSRNIILQDIANKCQEEIDRKFNSMISMLEPALVIILSLIVGMILLSVMLPLMGIMASL